MSKLNIDARIEMYAICASVEFDLKHFINNSNSHVKFTDMMLQKAKDRDKDSIHAQQEDILNQLDLQDFVDIIKISPFEYSANAEKVKTISRLFEKAIPVRNRVMHTKPIEFGDRALLEEMMKEIDIHIPWINWTETLRLRDTIENNPTKLLAFRYTKRQEYNTRIYHNLPEPEFDDTGFIGRQKDRKDIRDLILNRKNQIITIVGNGGVGKTAVVVKVLYDLVDDPECSYECIIWITLKTRTLSNGEFIEIADNIHNIPDMYNFSQKLIISEDGIPSREMLLKFMDEFKVLLVLDNLETVNAGEISDFIRDIPDKSKVLITSMGRMRSLGRLQ